MDDLKPAKYSAQSESEMLSVHIVKGLLLNRGFHPYISENDKTPNTDGVIDINDSGGFPLGKVEVQIKTLPKSYNKPNFNATLKMLAYARDSQLPFILIIVDQAGNKAFWQEISPQLARERIGAAVSQNSGQKTIVIHFDLENELSNEELHNNWLQIIQANKSILKNWSKVNSELENYRVQVLSLINEMEEIDSETGIDFVYINKYLEKLNSLANNEFKAIKRIFRNDFWRFGVALFKFGESNLSFGLFPIDWNENRKQIFRLRTEPANLGDYAFRYNLLKAHSGYNPIIDSPRKAAYKSISEYLSIIIDREILWPLDNNLQEEYLAYIVGRNFRTKYQLNRIVLSDLKKSIEELEALIPKEKELSEKYPERQHNLARAVDYIQNYQMEGVDNIQIKVPTHNDLRNIIISVAEEGVFPANIKSTLYEFWNRATQSYENVIKEYFPLLSRELSFFDGFNHLIVAPILFKNTFEGRPFSTAKILLILANGLQENKKITVADNYENVNLDVAKRTVTLNNKTFEYMGYNTISLSSISHELPIRNWVYKQLKERTKSYFNNKLLN